MAGLGHGHRLLDVVGLGIERHALDVGHQLVERVEIRNGNDLAYLGIGVAAGAVGISGCGASALVVTAAPDSATANATGTTRFTLWLDTFRPPVTSRVSQSDFYCISFGGWRRSPGNCAS
jgi:hypothetical protein